MQNKYNCLRFLVILLLLPAVAAIAQKTSKKGKLDVPQIAPLETRTSLIDSAVAEIKASLETFTLKNADRTDGSNKEKVFGYLAEGAENNQFSLLRNEMENSNGLTHNRFYLRDGKIFCWILFRQETAAQNPRARKRQTIYYCDGGKIFHAIQKKALLNENLDDAPFELANLDDLVSMTEFMNRKFQSLAEAFSPVAKASDN